MNKLTAISKAVGDADEVLDELCRYANEAEQATAKDLEMHRDDLARKFPLCYLALCLTDAHEGIREAIAEVRKQSVINEG
jgi:hypothetical protein